MDHSVVVLDNCTIHHDEEIRQIIETDCGMFLFTRILAALSVHQLIAFAGAKLIYLPPYSPDYNPIEEAFSTIKRWMRRHVSDVVNRASRPWRIHQAAQAITPNHALGWFENCGYY